MRDGRFKQGQSGNPKGKAKGCRNKATLATLSLLEGEAEKITRKAIDLALQGDMAAIKLCLERICPPQKHRPLKASLPRLESVQDILKAQADIIEQTTMGLLNIEEASALSGLIEVQRKLIETISFEARLKVLEGKQNGS